MKTESDLGLNGVDEEVSKLANADGQTGRKIYPELNSRYMGALKWFVIAFIALVLLIPQFSGYY